MELIKNESFKKIVDWCLVSMASILFIAITTLIVLFVIENAGGLGLYTIREAGEDVQEIRVDINDIRSNASKEINNINYQIKYLVEEISRLKKGGK